MAFIGLAKFMLLVGGLLFLIFSSNQHSSSEMPRCKWLSPQIAILVTLAYFALSITWTATSFNDALSSLGKYGKLLTILMIVILVRNRTEATCALGALAISQTFLMLSSWMLFFKLPVPWATSGPMSRVFHAVFSSYLDQGLMTAVFAALCWHLRLVLPGKILQAIAILISVIALLNVFFVLKGRTGHVVAIALLSLAIMWEAPKRYRLSAILLPIFLVVAVMAVSPKVRDRIIQVKADISNFSLTTGVSVDSGNSSGIRLHFWHRALQSISENPVLGSGVGSWSNEFNRLEKEKTSNPESIASMGNPHQEYLLWGVQLGIPGILLLLALLISVLHQALGMEAVSSRATLSVLASLAIACMFNSIIYDALIGDFFCIALGLLLSLGLHPASKISNEETGVERLATA